MYIYQHKDWPQFEWDKELLAPVLVPLHHKMGKLLGRMENLGFDMRNEAVLQSLSAEVIRSNEIEGEVLPEDEVRSSIARRLGIDIAGMVPADRNVDGVVEMMLDATQNYSELLTQKRLYKWHTLLFPSGGEKLTIGKWRNNDLGPMQVVSGPIGRQKIHFEAPAADEVEPQMELFLRWFNSVNEADPVLKAAIAHLWFLTIHPFDDGNGRMARTISDIQLARADDSPLRFYSMSAQIRIERKEYYNILERTQKGDLDITYWLQWFVACLDKAVTLSEQKLSGVINKASFWKEHQGKPLNERQIIMLNKLLDGFEGKLTTSKWAKIAKCSTDTALRDIQNLLENGMLAKEGAGGRSTSYKISGL